jgi:hypothetical protein
MRADNFWIPEFKRGCYLWAPPVGRKLQGLPTESDLDSGDILRELCKLAKRHKTVPVDVLILHFTSPSLPRVQPA